ncbi:MAG TPA: hypothetical protein VMF61_04245 [Candidatus Acidoferrales bacterium]|nr:hypothetical protein [Candidatus Acidoferrales bacterium]
MKLAITAAIAGLLLGVAAVPHGASPTDVAAQRHTTKSPPPPHRSATADTIDWQTVANATAT